MQHSISAVLIGCVGVTMLFITATDLGDRCATAATDDSPVIIIEDAQLFTDAGLRARLHVDGRPRPPGGMTCW
jgi:hypothetical protein